MSSMKAVALVRSRIAYLETAFVDLVLWQLPRSVAGSNHYKYRLAYVVNGQCAIRYDNEAGKGDHRHYKGRETLYQFIDPDRLIEDFQHDIARWNRENRDS
jgi:hypothetical protein